MKKIVCFTANLGAGGAEHQIVILSNLLAQRGYNITVVTYNDIPDDYELDPSIVRVRLDDNGGSVKRELVIAKYFLKADADCIISYRSTPNFVLLLPMMLRRRPKIICSERNTTRVANTMEKWNYNLLYRRAAYIVPNSHSQAKYLRGLGKSWSDRIVPITNYTELDKYVPSPSPPLKELMLFGIIARIFPQKNYERFCQMLAVLKKQAERPFKVIWYGDRQDGEHSKGSTHIRQLIDDLKIDDVIEVRPAILDVVGAMSQFHAMCLPSLYEGFSNSLSEYICCGKPVVCSDVSDNSLMVHEGKNGYLFDPTSIDSMSEAFHKILVANQAELDEMGKSSRHIAEELFDQEAFVNKYIKLIEN